MEKFEKDLGFNFLIEKYTKNVAVKFRLEPNRKALTKAT